MKHEKSRELFLEICKRSGDVTTVEEITTISKAFDRLDELEAFYESFKDYLHQLSSECVYGTDSN